MPSRFTLTKRDDAAATCGLAFGFNPYRVAHLSHLELLAAFGMPDGARGAASLPDASGGSRWIVAFALRLRHRRRLCATYFLLFFGIVLLGLVDALVRIARLEDRDGTIAAASVSASGRARCLPTRASATTAFIAFYGFTRSLGEITALQRRPHVVSSRRGPRAARSVGIHRLAHAGAFPAERQLFPGLTIIIASATIGCVAAHSPPAKATPRPPLPPVSTVLLPDVVRLGLLHRIVQRPRTVVHRRLRRSRKNYAAPPAMFGCLSPCCSSRSGPCSRCGPRCAPRMAAPISSLAVLARGSRLAFLFLCSMGPGPTRFSASSFSTSRRRTNG